MKVKINDSTIRIAEGGITRQNTTITTVNTVNTQPIGGAGVGGAIRRVGDSWYQSPLVRTWLLSI